MRPRLSIKDPPGAARIEIAELYAVKNKSVTLLCLLDGVGHPDVHAYSWYVNDTFLDETIANNYTIDNISMDTQVGSFSLLAKTIKIDQYTIEFAFSLTENTI